MERGASHPGRDMTALEAQLELAFSEKQVQRAGQQLASHLVEGNRLMRNIDRAPPGDIVRRASRKQSRTDLARHQSKRDFFEDAFSVNRSSQARERVHGDAIVMAEVKTNVIISDEFAFITELSYHLSTRYQRPVSSIVVTLHHGACMFFGGSFDPAYAMSVFALPSQLQPTTNKRNAALIQKHMEETLGVGPARGLLRFVPIQEERLACNGTTTAGEIDELERSCLPAVGGAGARAAARSSPPAPTSSRAGAEDWTDLGSRGRRARKKLSVKALAARRLSAAGDMAPPDPTPPGSIDEGLRGGSSPSGEQRRPIHETDGASPGSPQHKSAARKKSFVAAIFGWSGGKSSDRPPLPATIGEE